MTPAAVDRLCHRLSVTVQELRSPSRRPDLVRARAIAAHLLADHHDWDTLRIAEYLDRSPRQTRRLVADGAYLETRNVDGAGELCHEIRHAIGASR